MANLITGQTHLSGLGGSPHERLHQDSWGRRFRRQPLPNERLHQDTVLST
ncbi:MULTISPECIES: hypothetical protein [unclassified Moorena]|nr:MULTISPECIES: hypothetical protein [unclassified Moorena]NEO13234.1 hypothetical protein [Moorena sp. SIO3E8]